MASGSVLNRVGNFGGELLLWVPPSATGTIDSGVQMIEASGYKDWTFQIIGPGSAAAGYSVACYGTVDQTARAYAQAVGTLPTTVYPGTPLQATVTPGGKGSTGLAQTSWVLLPGPSEQSGTGSMGNPMITGTSNILRVGIPLVAVKVIVSVLGGQSNGIGVVCFATA